MASSSDTIIRVLDGEDTIGGSKILVGWGGEGVFLDFGINYGKWGHYYEEFLKPRATTGLGDLWRLGLVPPIRELYRPDVIPDSTPAGDALPVKRITGVYVSHAHLDHAGLAGLLRTEVPLVTSRMTAAILKAVQDSGKNDIFGQSVYATPYAKARVGGQAVMKAADSEQPYVGRDLLLTDGPGSAGFERFWSDPPNRDARRKGSRARDLDAGAVRHHQPSSGGPHATAFTVDHSVLGSNAFLLESPQGAIAYSGDLRAHGEHADGSRAFLNALQRKPPWILLMEGTQVREARPEDDALRENTGETEVEANCLRVVERYRGKLVVADFAPRNIERLKAFLRIAEKTGRVLVILPKDAYLLHAMHQADASVPLPSSQMLVFDPPAGMEQGWEKYIHSQYSEHVVHVDAVRARQGEFILCLSFFDMKHLLDIDPAGGCYIFSSSEAHSEEQEIDMERLSHWLALFRLDPIGFRMVRVPGRRRLHPHFERGFHASGHMPGDEVLEWVRRIRPDHVLPVHTEHAERFEEALRGTGIRVLKGGIG